MRPRTGTVADGGVGDLFDYHGQRQAYDLGALPTPHSCYAAVANYPLLLRDTLAPPNETGSCLTKGADFAVGVNW
ncbi:hypothetical protein LY78DRAFT_662857 [Colletotrichum sublineola]|nr:hypothetical protein LY78DRAFT_662857 [Colletotrichum sublineola]